MKKWICLMITAALCAAMLTGCGSGNGNNNGGQQNNAEVQEETATEDTAQDSDTENQDTEEQDAVIETEAEVQQEKVDDAADQQETENGEDAESEQPEAADSTEGQTGKVLVAYYSASGNTRNVGDIIAEYTGGDVFEIIPVNAYSAEDLDWKADGSRVNQEHEDESLQDIELVSTTVDHFDDYDTVFIGFPIWWREAAWVVNHFVTDNDFTGKTVIPFCTSSSSGLGESGTHLAEMAGTGNWQEGQRFSGNASESEVTGWLDGLGL